MTRPPKIIWIIAGVLFAAASVAINYQVKFVMHHRSVGSVQEMGNIKVGQPAPDFTLRDLSGHAVALSAYRGRKIVLMDFWATWCGPCRMAMPGLQELADKYHGHGLEILSVNQGEPADHVRDFIQREKYTFHVVLDQNQAVGGQYGVQGIPTLVLVDKKGVVRWIRVGYSPNDDDLKKLVEKLTKE
ncbi:MAG: TlpA family protein disulfide reductase [Verrucomicrobia bacterium]|nr:TlpA family protein disulfide reductase [Verrucomicrobiota bacterium]